MKENSGLLEGLRDRTLSRQSLRRTRSKNLS